MMDQVSMVASFAEFDEPVMLNIPVGGACVRLDAEHPDARGPERRR